MSTDIEVHVDVEGATLHAGIAHFTRNRGRVTTAFTYAPSYLATSGAPAIDPELPLVSGTQYVARLPGAFSDGAPDRWGRNLIDKRERSQARDASRRARSLDDVDYLLGVSDETRQGALRYRLPGADGFAGPDGSVPKLIDLPQLLRASDSVVDDESAPRAVKALLDAGTGSLGGARPKAAVRWDDGRLGIAKFPHASDQWDVMAWEALSLQIAEDAGLPVPVRRLVQVGDRNVLLLVRFDRTEGNRIGYISAMTALETTDGDAADYVDLADRLTDLSARIRADRAGLFARVALNVAIGNTDDHLRNLGFLADRALWRLSPVFDVNPNPDLAARRQTAIGGAVDVDDEVDGLRELARACGLDRTAAGTAIARVVESAERWRSAAAAIRIPEREIQRMAEALDHRVDALRAF